MTAYLSQAVRRVRCSLLEESVQPPTVALVWKASAVDIEFTAHSQRSELTFGKTNEIACLLVARQFVHFVEIWHHEDGLEPQHGIRIVAIWSTLEVAVEK